MAKNKNSEPYLELISGISTSKLVDALEEQLDDPMSINRVYDAIDTLHGSKNEDTAYGLVRVLYDLTGLYFPVEAESLCDTVDGRNEYLENLLMDMAGMI